MRNRLEDLGCCLILTQKLLEHPLFESRYWHRPKDAISFFNDQPEEVKNDIINDVAYSLESIKSDLYAILSICHGTDYLSQNTQS